MSGPAPHEQAESATRVWLWLGSLPSELDMRAGLRLRPDGQPDATTLPLFRSPYSTTHPRSPYAEEEGNAPTDGTHGHHPSAFMVRRGQWAHKCRRCDVHVKSIWTCQECLLQVCGLCLKDA